MLMIKKVISLASWIKLQNLIAVMIDEFRMLQWLYFGCWIDGWEVVIELGLMMAFWL